MDSEILGLPFGDIQLRRGGSGRPVVVLHRDIGPVGWTGFHEALAKDHEVVVPSLPGFDGSPLPTWLRDPIHLAVMTGQMMDRLGIALPCPVIGLGFGGWIAAALATMGSDRISDLVLVSPMGVKPQAGEIVDQFLFTAARYVELGFSDRAHFEQLFTAEPSLETQELWDRARDTMTRIAWKPIGYDPQLPVLLEGVRARALVAWGDADRIVPPACEQWSRMLPDCRTALLSGGHHLDLEAPEKLAELVREFLR